MTVLTAIQLNSCRKPEFGKKSHLECGALESRGDFQISRQPPDILSFIHRIMFHFRRRRRLYALLGAGVVAGGCAAYAAYSFGWFSTLAREED